MAEQGYMADPEMNRITNEDFIKKAEAALPPLIETEVYPVRIIEAEKDGNKTRICKEQDIETLSRLRLTKGEHICLDFGNHQVGYISLSLASAGSPQDSPAYIRLKFAETVGELLEDSREYDGWISSSWIQEEYIHIDVLPALLKLERRYAFRYVDILVIDTSPKWQLVIQDASVKALSSANADRVQPLHFDDKILSRIDEISLRTLHNCMQTVFEDGPKRDRRLWLGDLRLQALTNYATFANTDLVKRCLYLFAGLLRDDGRIGACIFTEPDYIVDDTFFFDYSLFFIPTLLDYYQATQDRETLSDLWGNACRQIELVLPEFDSQDLISEEVVCFIDWKEGLSKQAGAQAVYIYCVKAAAQIAHILGDAEKEALFTTEAEKKAQAAKRLLWDPEAGLFTSGRDRQISYASQVWMMLAGTVSPDEGREIFSRLEARGIERGMVTPYMNHHYAEALIYCGKKDQALEFIKQYWGGMAALGADTFFELYNPDFPDESPYGSAMINSYCHAWSCTPAYLLRAYFS